MTTKTCMAAIALAFSAAANAAMTTYYWGKVDDSYDGSFDDGAHWHAGSSSGTTGTVPDVDGCAYFDGVNASYTLTFPSGVYTNFARLNPTIYTGKTVVLDGHDTVLVQPENTTGTYSTDPLAFFLDTTVRDIIAFHTDGASPNPTTSPRLEWSNFHITMSRPTARNASVVMAGGKYDFLHPCGFNWNWSVQKPYLYFFSLNNNDATATKDLMDNLEVTFNNASLLAPVVGIQGNANTNILTLVGGEHKFGVVEMPAKFNGLFISERATYTEFVLDGATVDVTNRLNIVNWAQASQRVERVVLKNGSKLLVPYMYMVGNSQTPAKAEISLDSSQLTFGLNGANSQSINNGPFTLVATNGSTVVVDHKGTAAGANGHGLYLGDSSATASAETPIRHFVKFDGSAALLKNGSKWNFYGASVAFRNGSRINNSGSMTLVGNSGGMPLDFTLDGSVVTNLNTFNIGTQGPAALLLTNGAAIVTSTEMRLGGGAEAAVETPSSATVNINGGSLQALSGGKFRLGEAGGASATVNMRSGKIFDDSASTIESLTIGFAGTAEFNMYGGEIDVFMATIGSVTRSDYTHTDESVFRLYDGDVKIRSAGNGWSQGLVVAGGSNRKGRLVLNGGTVTAYTVCGGDGATCKGGTGSAALEANGGTIRAISESPALVHDFDTATIGANGLVIDSNGNNVTVQQSFADATGESGLLVLTGTGAKTMSGDLSGVSSVAVAGGSASFSSALGALAVTNGASLKLDPAATLAVESITLADLSVSLSATVAIGNTYDLVAVENEPSAATVAAWQNAFVTTGLPAGAAADLSCENVGSGYVLRMTVRAAQSLEVTLDAGTETRAGDISYAPQDTLTATVAAGADLTLSGAVGMGTLVKAGDGALRLSCADNIFMPGFLLTAGSISTANPDAIKVGSSGSMRVKHGVLEVLGPAGGATIDGQITMVQESTNDIFIVKNEVDLAMPCPVGNGTTGEFMKRGAGTLTLTVEGTKTLTGGKGCGKINNNHLGWTVESVSQLTFDGTSGMVTTNGVWPLTIAEGELRIVGRGEGAKVSLNGSAVVGTSTKVGTAQPGLVLDNVKLAQTKYPDRWVHLAPAINYSAVAASARSGDFVTDPYIILTNGAHLVNDTVQISRFGQSSSLRPRIEVDGSTFEAAYLYMNRAQDNVFTTRTVFRNGSHAYIRYVCPGYDGEVELDNSILAWNSSLESTTIVPESTGSTTSSGRFFFRNRSKLYCAKVSAGSLNVSKLKPLTLTFDDSEWIPATTNFVFAYDADRISIVATNIGLRLPVPEGKTWTMNHRVTGPGGLANDGEGTLVLGANAVGYEGATVAGENATVDLGGNGLPVRIGGAGTFTNGTVANGGIALEIDDAGAAVEVPTVASDVTFSGTVRVLAGRTSETPLSEPYATFDVVKYEGSAPDVSAFRLRGTGVSGLRGKFAVDASRNVVVCTPEKHGFILEVR